MLISSRLSQRSTATMADPSAQCFLVRLTLLLLAVASGSGNRYCGLPCELNGRLEEHTICRRRNVNCGPDPQCGPDYQPVYLTEDDRRYIVDIHNFYRNKIAMGKETRGRQPPAANMNVLKYNRELEQIAQCWVNACKGRNGQFPPHDVCRRTSEHEHVGQNIGFVSKTNVAKLDIAKTIKSSILAWYNEVANFDASWVPDTRIRQAIVGHYTQMVWAETSEIGCALSYYTRDQGRKWHYLLFACNYGPSGNILGTPLYEVGVPASKCKSGKKNPNYGGLCTPGSIYAGNSGSQFGATSFNFTTRFVNVFI